MFEGLVGCRLPSSPTLSSPRRGPKAYLDLKNLEDGFWILSLFVWQLVALCVSLRVVWADQFARESVQFSAMHSLQGALVRLESLSVSSFTKVGDKCIIGQLKKLCNLK